LLYGDCTPIRAISLAHYFGYQTHEAQCFGASAETPIEVANKHSLQICGR
jgi:hypothetical protein